MASGSSSVSVSREGADCRLVAAGYATCLPKFSIAAGFLNLGDTERSLGNLVAARTDYDESLRIAHTLEHKALIGVTLQGLGEVALDQLEYTQARSYSEEALRISRELGNKSSIGFALSNLGAVARKLGEKSKALTYYGQKLQIMQQVGYKWAIATALEEITTLLSEIDQPSEAPVHFLAAAAGLRQEIGIPVPPNQQAEYAAVTTRLRQQRGEKEFHALWNTEQTTPLDQIVAEALRLLL